MLFQNGAALLPFLNYPAFTKILSRHRRNKPKDRIKPMNDKNNKSRQNLLLLLILSSSFSSSSNVSTRRFCPGYSTFHGPDFPTTRVASRPRFPHPVTPPRSCRTDKQPTYRAVLATFIAATIHALFIIRLMARRHANICVIGACRGVSGRSIGSRRGIWFSVDYHTRCFVQTDTFVSRTPPYHYRLPEDCQHVINCILSWAFCS